MALKHIQIVSVPVSDQERAKRFYIETLGFELRSPEDAQFGEGQQGQRWVEVAPPGATTGLTLVTWFPSMPAGSLQGLVLTTDDVHGDYEALKARGVTFEGEIESAPWGTWATFHDPDGNGWVLQQNA